jgi:hypothetical protein
MLAYVPVAGWACVIPDSSDERALVSRDKCVAPLLRETVNSHVLAKPSKESLI